MQTNSAYEGNKAPQMVSILMATCNTDRIAYTKKALKTTSETHNHVKANVECKHLPESL